MPNLFNYVPEHGTFLAQSFKPSFNKINRVKLFVGKHQNPAPFIVSIRNELNGEDLTSVNVTVDSMFTWDWYRSYIPPNLVYDFYFPEIDVIPGETYYIVCRPEEIIYQNHYHVRNAVSDNGSVYEDGCLYYNDDGGEWICNESADLCFATFYDENCPPNEPDPPVGQTTGQIWMEYTYCSSAIDSENDNIFYWFQWSNDSYSGWIGPYASGEIGEARNIWTEVGTYNVKVKVKDNYGGAESSWSDILKVTIIENEPPDPPIVDGPTNGNAGTEYNYTFVSSDPDGDDIANYNVDWGDDNTEVVEGPFASGEEIIGSHTWSEKGTYTIRAKATDVYGAESEWGTLSVTMPKNQQSVQQQSQQLSFPQQIFRLLGNILNR